MATRSVNIIDGDKLSDELTEQLKYDLENQPIRKLSERERRIYMHVVAVALRHIPAFRDAIALIRPYMDATCETAYTDQYARVAFGYWFFYILNEDQQASVLLHECMHVLNNHFARRAEINSLKKNQKLFNIAGDLEINTVLNRVPFIDLKNACLPDHEPFFFAPMRTMEIYGELLMKKQKEQEENCPVHGKDAEEKKKGQQKQDQQDKQSGQQDQQEKKDKDSGDDSGDDFGDDPQDQGDEAGADSGDQDGGQQPGDETPGDEGGDQDSDGGGDGQGSGPGSQPGTDDGHEHGDSGPKCNCGKDHGDEEGDGDGDGQGSGQGQGSGAGQGQGQGQGSGADQGQDGKGWGCGDADEGTEQAADDAGIQRASDVETAIAKANTAARIVEEKNSKSRGLGHMDALFDSVLQHLLPKKVDWRKLFRQVLTQSRAAIIRGRQDYTYRRVSRRLTDTPFVFPGMVNYLPKITLGIDTSGSMGNEDYQRLLNEIDGILHEVAKGKDAVSMFSVDTKVGGIKPVSSVKRVNLTGGGGTQMAVAWRYIRDEVGKNDKPDIFVLSTDGYIDWDDVEREVREAKFKSIILVTQFGGFQQAPESLKKLIPIICIDEDAK